LYKKRANHKQLQNLLNQKIILEYLNQFQLDADENNLAYAVNNLAYRLMLKIETTPYQNLTYIFQQVLLYYAMQNCNGVNDCARKLNLKRSTLSMMLLRRML
jgi:ActR/RegA family two-component response regulator